MANDGEVIHAIRPFVASQSGQITVHGDDEMILLSDSHWYWWFVRVISSQQVGFVPYEIVELPNERLARQNRQRNIHLALNRPEDSLLPPFRRNKPYPRPRVHFETPNTTDEDGEHHQDAHVIVQPPELEYNNELSSPETSPVVSPETSPESSPQRISKPLFGDNYDDRFVELFGFDM